MAPSPDDMISVNMKSENRSLSLVRSNNGLKSDFLKMGQPRSLFVYFQSFQTKNIILTTNQYEKGHVNAEYKARIQTHDLLNMSHHP